MVGGAGLQCASVSISWLGLVSVANAVLVDSYYLHAIRSAAKNRRCDHGVAIGLGLEPGLGSGTVRSSFWRASRLSSWSFMVSIEA